jgi:hypothetical protein
MLILATSTDKLDLITGSAVTIDVHTSFLDNPSGTTVTPGKQNTAISTAATTDIVAAPSTGYRNVKTINVRNRHGSSSVDVTVRFNQNATIFELIKITLRAGETLQYIEGVGWFVVGPASAPARNASSADQVANAADTYITGSQILIPSGRTLQVGTVMIWKFTATKTAAGTATPIFSIRFGSGVIGDTARHTLTGVAQTGAADTATIEIVCIVRSIGGSGVTVASLDLHHVLAATGFANVAHQVIQNTSAGFDTTAVTGVGVSVNPGTAGVWTFTMATAEIANL